MTEPMPRPWHVGPTNNDPDEPDEIAILGAEGFCPAVAIPSGARRDLTPELTRANAELIVRAVNNHERLVEALAALAAKIDLDWSQGVGVFEDGWGGAQLLDKAKAALRAARGER